jgi:hypothetical protein
MTVEAIAGVIYDASPIKRRQATKDEMEERAEFLIDYAEEHSPVTVRGLYYQAEVAGVPGIDKDDKGYAKVQRQVLSLRREGRLPYGCIADATRWMRKPKTHDSVEGALHETAKYYRKALWRDSRDYVEVWCEKDALAGVILPVTEMYDVPLMITRGFSSETFCFEAVEEWEPHEVRNRVHWVYYLGDFDRAGQDAARSLEEKLERFANERGVLVIFEQIAVTEEQIDLWQLPTREPKRKSPVDKQWPFERACELDAIPPDTLRELVQDAIEYHLPADRLKILKIAEESERTEITRLVEAIKGGSELYDASPIKEIRPTGVSIDPVDRIKNMIKGLPVDDVERLVTWFVGGGQ